MDERQVDLDWSFALQWLVSCAVGTAIGGALAFFTMWSAGEAVAGAVGEIAGGLVSGGMFGAALALGANAGPGFLLERRGLGGTRWLIFSAIVASVSAGMAVALTFTLLDSVYGPAMGIFIGLVLGAPMGIVQWVILRQHGIAADAWPVVSVVAYLLAAFFITSGGEDSALALTLGGAGLSVAAVTALGATWMLGQQTTAPA